MLLWLYKVHMITLLTIHCVKSLKLLLVLEIPENRYSTLDFRLILITWSLSEHDQYSELEMTLQDHKDCLSATYNSTLFRHGHLSSLLRTGKRFRLPPAFCRKVTIIMRQPSKG